VRLDKDIAGWLDQTLTGQFGEDVVCKLLHVTDCSGREPGFVADLAALGVQQFVAGSHAWVQDSNYVVHPGAAQGVAVMVGDVPRTRGEPRVDRTRSRVGVEPHIVVHRSTNGSVGRVEIADGSPLVSSGRQSHRGSVCLSRFRKMLRSCGMHR